MILTEEKRKEVLEKISKLMAHTGEGAVNVNEITVANQKIKDLVEEYGVSIDEARDVKSRAKNVLGVSVDTYHTSPRRWVGSLSAILANFYDCRTIQIRSRFVFVGFDLDAQAASEMFTRLYLQINVASKMINARGSNDFSFGVVISLKNRLIEVKQKRQTADITALVLVKKDAVDNEYEEMFPNVTKGTKIKFNLSGDYNKGLEYGKTMEIFKSVK